MSKQLKTALAGIVISLIAMIVAGIGMIQQDFNGGSIAIFCSIVTVFIVNIALFHQQKRKEIN